MNQYKRVLLVASLFLYSLTVSSKTVVISDIDDTIKMSNSMGKPLEQAFHFLQKKPYLAMRDLYNEIKLDARHREDTYGFYYVSAAYSMTFKADKWIRKLDFPKGRTILRDINNKIPTYDFKYNVISQILKQEIKNLDVESGEELIVYMFGDNAQFDAVVYDQIKRELNLPNANIFIRDVRAEATYFDSNIPVKKIDNIDYYFSEVELLAFNKFDFVSSDLKNKTHDEYVNKSLIPKYTLKTLERRLVQFTNDKEQAKNEALKFWSDYYSRF